MIAAPQSSALDDQLACETRGKDCRVIATVFSSERLDRSAHEDSGQFSDVV